MQRNFKHKIPIVDGHLDLAESVTLFGRDGSPLEINSVADLYKIGSVVPHEVREAVLSDNWLNFLRRSLPQ